MSLFTFIWNATEYLCYISIIAYSALCFGLFGAKAQEDARTNSEGSLDRALALLNKVVDQFNSSSNKPVKKTR